MEKSGTHYLVEAVCIIRANIYYVLITVLLFTSFYFFNFLDERLKIILFFLVASFIIIVWPLFYGQFIEIINYGKKDTWKNILSNYWLKFFLASMILRAPLIILDLFASEMYALDIILSLIIGIVSIYILPLVLLKKEIFNSIHLGIKCLLGNLKFSLPLIIAIICTLLFPFLIVLVNKYTNSQFLVAVFSIVYILLWIVIEFLVFIAASLILKEKLLTTQPTFN